MPSQFDIKAGQHSALVTCSHPDHQPILGRVNDKWNFDRWLPAVHRLGQSAEERWTAWCETLDHILMTREGIDASHWNVPYLFHYFSHMTIELFLIKATRGIAIFLQYPYFLRVNFLLPSIISIQWTVLNLICSKAEDSSKRFSYITTQLEKSWKPTTVRSTSSKSNSRRSQSLGTAQLFWRKFVMSSSWKKSTSC